MSQWETLQTDKIWAAGYSVNGRRTRVHLLKEAGQLTRHGETSIWASYRCGSDSTKAELMYAAPDNLEPCDDCLLADVVGPIVYEFYDDADELIYIGYTVNFIHRITWHRKNSEWWPHVLRYEAQLWESAEAGLTEERRLIELHQPRFNKRHTKRYSGTRKLVAVA